MYRSEQRNRDKLGFSPPFVSLASAPPRNDGPFARYAPRITQDPKPMPFPSSASVRILVSIFKIALPRKSKKQECRNQQRYNQKPMVGRNTLFTRHFSSLFVRCKNWRIPREKEEKETLVHSHADKHRECL